MSTPRPPSGLQPNEPPWQLRMLGYADAVVGGAVLLSPHLLVTCAHVVNAALDRHGDTEAHPGPQATVRLRSFDDRLWQARVLPELWAAGPGSRDLAMLHLTGPGLPDTGFPVLRECADLADEQRLYTTGYPTGMRSLRASLVYLGPGGPTQVTHQAETPADRSAQITGGFSGCAVRTGTGELVGIMQKNHYYAWDDPDQPSGIAFLLPVEELVGPRDGDETVSAQRLTDESLCGRAAYDRLHDLLDSVAVDEVPPETVLRPDELHHVRRHGSGATAWRVLTALWDLVPPAGEPPPRVAWVHHVYRELKGRRPLPPLVWPWIREEALSLGRGWEAALKENRQQRLANHRGPAAHVDAAPAEDRPETVVRFDLEPLTGGYKLSYGIAHLHGRTYRLLPHDTRVVDEADICDVVGDLMGEFAMQRLIIPDEESLRLRFWLPKHLLHLRLGQAAPHRDLMKHPPRLGTTYEIVYHVWERVQNPGYLGTPPQRWQRRSEQQLAHPWLDDSNVLPTWKREVGEIVHVLGNKNMTVCAVDSDHDEVLHVYDAAIHQGIPTLIRGPRQAVHHLVDELLEREPGSRVRVPSLPRFLRDRAQENAESREIALIQDDFDDHLWNRFLRDGGPGRDDPEGDPGDGLVDDPGDGPGEGPSFPQDDSGPINTT
ncbi:trypsin-like peptidase [Nocardiopsis sp. Huas11]|uniref:S1 family peptidase n=1 Tax=Nocardiopsis sp. Huas11 TaxID=2183912 RepID=UPI000F2A8E7A|nr:serine protease [Nocardiopsis sp. Huas11]RKS06938.1 trypsin-like peptidase [Nocardiopsis sp. Huas11]